MYIASDVRGLVRRSDTDLLRQQSRDLAKLAAATTLTGKKYKKKQHIPHLHKKGQKFAVSKDK